MASDEDRYHLFQKLEEILGAPEASTLMSHLAPTGWADVATRRDLDSLETRMLAKFDQVDARITALEATLTGRMEVRFGELQKDMRMQALTLFGLNFTMFAGAIALLRFL